ncbi:MAG: hypothetical protein U0528_10585 [Anaerolineae bacterium]
MNPTSADRFAHYQRRLRKIEVRLAVQRQLADGLTWLRLLTFLGGVILSIAAFFAAGSSVFFLVTLLSLIAFFVVASRHRLAVEGILRLTIWQRLTNQQIARLRLDWSALPPAILTPDPDHPFELDVDLVGERSLHQLVDTAISRTGSARLREWLTLSAPQATFIEKRQAIVRELIDQQRLRDQLHVRARLAADGSPRQWDGIALSSWLEQPDNGVRLRPVVIVLGVLAVINIVLFTLNFYVAIPGWLRAAPFAAYAFMSIAQMRHVQSLFERSSSLLDSLRQLDGIFSTLERFNYRNTPHFHELCAPFIQSEDRPSSRIRIIARIMAAASLQTSQILWLIINTIVPWDITSAYLLGQQKQALEKLLPRWLETWFEVEALNSLANFAYLNPAYTFPVIENRDAHLSARSLGHPLIPAERRVSNDFSISQRGEIAIITGSNMSGKSSFLRTLGINLSLAFAGSVVAAQDLRTTPFRLYTSIHISDSLADGFSYFYAEVRRLKRLLSALDADHELPLFFLIDEIFRGTNNRERLIGSRAYIRALVGKNGIGVVSTHDLELIKLAEEMPQVHNYHFADDVIDGKMIFDYRLRSGPSPTTNALRIMALEGLPVEIYD